MDVRDGCEDHCSAAQAARRARRRASGGEEIAHRALHGNGASAPFFFALQKIARHARCIESLVYLGNAERAGGDTWGQGLNLSLVGTIPLGQSLGLNGKVGAIYGWTKTGGAGAPGFATGRDHGLGFSYGLGLTYALSRTVDLRLDWDRYQMKFTTGREDVDLGTVGVAFKF